MAQLSNRKKPKQTTASRLQTTPRASSASVRRRMQSTKQRDTPCELALRRQLHSLGLRYRIDATVHGTRRRVDIAFPKAKVAVFVDGCFWHGCPQHGTWPKTNAKWWRDKIHRNQQRDRDTDQTLAASGWTVLRFWEHMDPQVSARLVMKALKD